MDAVFFFALAILSSILFFFLSRQTFLVVSPENPQLHSTLFSLGRRPRHLFFPKHESTQEPTSMRRIVRVRLADFCSTRNWLKPQKIFFSKKKTHCRVAETGIRH